MILLKRSLLLMLLSGLFVFTACNDEDEDCMPPALSENIVGEWQVSTTNDIVEFQADGTLVDPNDAVIAGSANSEKTYVASGMTLTVTLSEGGASFSSEFDVTSNECDEIVVSFVGADVTFTRQ
jgi:hypothetical protein